ncbi:MAG: radical SAM family heme chaperone HemW [Gammaproteobacteria bacterium]
MLQFSESIPLSLYIHIPWCVRKCPYCDFNSHALRQSDELPERLYVDALLADLEADLPRIWGRRVDTVFIGGGTPSLFSPAAIDRLLSGVRARLTLRPDAEITLEANPGTVEQGRFAEFRAAGISRLSIGIQSFNEQHLQALGRIHGRPEAIRAAQSASQAGFDNFNLDLMYGLPEQTPVQALDDLRTAIELAPSHISYYQLTLEPNTLFHRYPPPLPDDDALWDMQERAQALLAEHGYRQYEISAYARMNQPTVDRRCAHNLNYWRFGDYLGIGAGAHGKLSDMAEGAVYRLWKRKNPRDFLNYAGQDANLGGLNRLSEAELPLEFMLNALRLSDGWPLQLFQQRTGLELGAIQAALHEAETRGLLRLSADRVGVTELGQRFLNDALQLFMPEQDLSDA